MDFIEIMKVILLGIIQGITEWLPISSTGHMILADEFIGLNTSKDFMDMFQVVIQLGSIFAVILLYFNKLNPFGKSKEDRASTLSMWCKVLVASIPAAIIGLLFDNLIDEYMRNYITVSITLIIYGILFIIIEASNKGKRTLSLMNNMSQFTFKAALIIGVFQVLALIPGTSRSGATILGAILIGASRPVAAEFSFFMAIPVMFGASGLKLVKYGFNFTPSEIVALFLGMFIAFLVSMAAIKFLISFIRKRDFMPFGIYRIILGFIILLLMH